MSVNKREHDEDIEYHLFKSSPKSFIFYKITRSIGRIFFSHGLIVILLGLLMVFVCNSAKSLKENLRGHEDSIVTKNNSNCSTGVVPVSNYLNIIHVNSSASDHKSTVSEKVSKNVKNRVESKSIRNKAERRECDILPRIPNSNR